jgi:hypothetical protein
MLEGYLSKDRNRINTAQRLRRARMTRIDYMPSAIAVAIMEAKRAQARPRSLDTTHSAVLDAILSEWASFTGIKYMPESKPTTSGTRPELVDHYTRAKNSEFCQSKRAPARASNYGDAAELARFAGARAKDSGPIKQGSAPRVACGARRRRDGQPCQALSVPGRRRCRWHGGCSTGPKTEQGRSLARKNLVQYRPPNR